MMMNRKMRKKEHVKKIQRQYNILASKRRNEIRKLVLGLKGELISWNFTCSLCGHHRIKGYLYNDGNQEYEICKFCNDTIFNRHDYLKIHYTPMGNKR